MPVTAAAMEAILDYAYNGQMKLNSMNAVEVLKAIDFFLMMNIMKKCADFVLDYAITTDNAFPLRSLFSDARLCDCKARANNFIKVHAILKLINADQICFYLGKFRKHHVKRPLFATEKHRSFGDYSRNSNSVRE